MKILPFEIEKAILLASDKLIDRPKLQQIFKNCFIDTLATTTELMDDGTTFVITGDISAMWLRDSSAQVCQYIPFARHDEETARIISGLVRRQIEYIAIDPYANAFNREPNGQCYNKDLTECNPWVWERKYELDSLCYPMHLAGLYLRETGRTDIFTGEFRQSMETVLRIWRDEQYHEQKSSYRFERPGKGQSETLTNNGLGAKSVYTGMTWSGFRPSDDACQYGYLVPANMFAVVALRDMEQIAKEQYHDTAMAIEIADLRAEIDAGIQSHGIFDHPKYGKIYVYETDGMGNYNLMDDANVPSLLSIPYIGYTDASDPIYQNTRRFVLSKDNPYYYEGKYASGIGSPHTPKGYIWHIALCMQALTSTNRMEIDRILQILEKTDDGTCYMQESFDPNNPANFTRSWFAWANSLAGELIYKFAVESRG